MAADDRSNNDRPAHDIGYGKPPTDTRFRKGVSGNPKGRKKGSKGLATVVKQIVNDIVPITENGRRHKITKLEATIKQLVNKAASGDPRATQSLLQLVQVIEGRLDAAVPIETTNEMDRQVMDGLLARLHRSSNGDSDGNPDAS